MYVIFEIGGKMPSHTQHLNNIFLVNLFNIKE